MYCLEFFACQLIVKFITQILEFLMIFWMIGWVNILTQHANIIDCKCKWGLQFKHIDARAWNYLCQGRNQKLFDGDLQNFFEKIWKSDFFWIFSVINIKKLKKIFRQGVSGYEPDLYETKISILNNISTFYYLFSKFSFFTFFKKIFSLQNFFSKFSIFLEF